MSDHDPPVATNLRNCQFEAEAPHWRWVGDTTVVIGSSNELYLAAILDQVSGSPSARRSVWLMIGGWR